MAENPNQRHTSQPQIVNPAQYVRSPDYKDVYSNFVRVAVGPTDFTIAFSKLVEPAAGLTVPEDQVLVRMSPQQMKIFIDQAGKTLLAWEQVFGELTNPVKNRSQEQIAVGIQRLKEALDRANS